ncbi:hypothetical protein LTR10_007025 [Elasticomyces elasticus]|nr:hypothetical protein LTR10_007025 [Elasticomyces elasticus]KAK4978843.1 hypothetical protein LTR42_001343 [Elasticomyces elasticus]
MTSRSRVPAAPPPLRVVLLESALDFFDTDEYGVARLKDLNDHQLEQLAETSKTVQESQSFRPGAASTHSRLDRHLREYRLAMILSWRLQGRQHELLTEDANQNDNDPLFFPNDNIDQIYANIAFYITFVCPRIKARKSSDKAIKLGTLTSRRWSILHWLRIFLEKPPNYRRLQAKTNPALYYAAQKFGIKPSRYNKTYLGRYEILHLIDKELETMLNVEVSESHILAWCLAFICGIRPGAIGWVRGRNDSFLRWEHIKITRDPNNKCKFILEITLPFMKGFQDLSKSEEGLDGALELTVMPPNNADNIGLCPTYRMLITMLRRGLLVHYKNVQELLQDERFNILVKPEHLSKPVFYAVAPGGRALDTTKPASSSGFSEFLQRRADREGFPKGCTIYSFRRETGTRTDRAEGRVAARRLLHHGPQTTTFEKYYERGNYDLDIGRIAYGEVTNPGEMVDRTHTVLFRATLHLTLPQQQRYIDDFVTQYSPPDASKNAVRRTRRYALRALQDEAAEVFKEDLTITQLKERKDALRKPSALTQAMYVRAKAKLEELNAKQARKRQAADSDDDSDDEYDDDDEWLGFEDEERDVDEELQVASEDDATGETGGDEDSAAADDLGDDGHIPASEDVAMDQATDGALEDRFQTKDDRSPNLEWSTSAARDNIRRAKALAPEFDKYPPSLKKSWLATLAGYIIDDSWVGQHVSAQRDHAEIPALLQRLSSKYKPKTHVMETDRLAEDDGTNISAVPYELALAALFDLMLDTDPPPKDPRQCAECIADDTITDEDVKCKWHQNLSNLRRHLSGKLHTPYSRWARNAESNKANAEDKLYHCYSPCTKTFQRLNKFEEHLEDEKTKVQDELARNGDKQTNNPHHQGLASDGWLSPLFKESRRTAAEKAAAAEQLKEQAVKRHGHRPRITELEAARPAVIDGKPHEHVYVGPHQQSYSDVNLLSYPSDLDVGDNSIEQLRSECEQKGLIGKFVEFGGESSQSAPTDTWNKRGISEDKGKGKNVLPKF